MALNPPMSAKEAVFRYIFCVLNCHVSGADYYSRTYVYQNTYNPSYIKLETEINFQNDVTFVIVRLDTKFIVQNS